MRAKKNEPLTYTFCEVTECVRTLIRKLYFQFMSSTMAFVTTLKMKVDVSFLEVIRWTILSLPFVSDLEELTVKMDELNRQRRNLTISRLV